MSKSLLEAFEEKHIPEPMSGCWLWTGYVNDSGYGLIDVRKIIPRPVKSAYLRAHRFSYENWKGTIPDGMIVCHTCDLPSCVNPDHLFLGTHRDNHDDCLRKGRAKMPPQGLRPNATLTIEHVIKIKTTGGKLKDVAAKYGVAMSMISNIRRGKSWADVGPFIPLKIKPPQTQWLKRKAEIQMAYRARQKARMAASFP